MRVLVIRHGTTALNESDCIRGWMDVPLSYQGLLESRELGYIIRDEPIDVLIISDMQRAAQTAAHLQGRMRIKARWLRPWNLGEFTGQPSPQVHAAMVQYILAPAKTIPGGESFNSFRDRFFVGLQQTMRRYAGQLVALVTHHRVERLLSAWDALGQPADYKIDLQVFSQKGIAPGSFRLLEIKDVLN